MTQELADKIEKVVNIIAFGEGIAWRKSDKLLKELQEDDYEYYKTKGFKEICEFNSNYLYEIKDSIHGLSFEDKYKVISYIKSGLFDIYGEDLDTILTCSLTDNILDNWFRKLMDKIGTDKIIKLKENPDTW